jgi:hypothetical protein
MNQFILGDANFWAHSMAYLLKSSELCTFKNNIKPDKSHVVRVTVISRVCFKLSLGCFISLVRKNSKNLLKCVFRFEVINTEENLL